jgi:YVTN family beta-propeller protein
MRPLAATTAILLAALALDLTPPAARADFVNWESPPIHPVEMTPDGATLLVTNTADDRLEVFTLGGPLPVWTASIPVGLDPVSVRARTNGEIWVVNRMSDSVSIVDLTARNVVATLFPGDEPADVVFAGSPQRAFVSVAQLNQVNVYDPANRATPPTIVPIQGKDPRALATDGTRVYVAIFESGNRSMILPADIVSDPSGPHGGQNPPPFLPALGPGLPAPPPTSLIINKEGTNWKDDTGTVWDAMVTWNLNENDVAVISTGNLSVAYAKDLLNIDMALAVQPGTGKVTVVGTYGPNETRFESAASNQFARIRMGIFDPANLGGPQGGRRPESASLRGAAEPDVQVVGHANRAASLGERSARHRVEARRVVRVRERHGLELDRAHHHERHTTRDHRRRAGPDRPRARRDPQPALLPEPLRRHGVGRRHHDRHGARTRRVLRSDAGGDQSGPALPL